MIDITNEDLDIVKIADSGQCFRLNKLDDDCFILTAKNKVLKIKVTNGGAVFYCDKKEYCDTWHDYFDLSVNYSKFRQAVNKNDEFLHSAAKYSKGIRILKQDSFEMLITFIISQRKNIPAIKKSVEMLCEMCNNKIRNEHGIVAYAFPTAEQIAMLSEQQLKECSLGYRAKYINAAANMVKSGSINLNSISALSNEDLLNVLMSIPGVGAKVANCVVLFGYYRLDGFPRDVWINRIIDTVYSGKFNEQEYFGFEGVIQQYMFYYGRSEECLIKFLNNKG